MIRHPALVLAILTGLNLLNYLDRYVVSAILPLIEADLHLSKFVQGSLATFFLIGYFATSPYFGVLGDRGNRTRLIAGGVAVWSLATVLSGLATGTWSLIGARILVGVGEASYATIAPTIIDDLAPKEKKGRWLAIFYSAIPIGSALGFIFGGSIGQAHGWRAALFLAGGPGLVLALLCLLVAEPARAARSDAAARESMWAAAKALLPLRLYRRTVLGYAAFTAAMGGFAFWAPSFLVHTYDLPLKKSNFLFGAITVVAGAIGTFVGGVWGDRSAAKDHGDADADKNRTRGYLAVCAMSAGLGAPIAAACFLAPTANTFFLLAAVCQIALFLSTSPINAAILRSVPESRRASAMALSIFAIHMFGDLWSPPIIGALADFVPMRIAMFVVPVAFALGAAIWWVPKSRRAVTA